MTKKRKQKKDKNERTAICVRCPKCKKETPLENFDGILDENLRHWARCKHVTQGKECGMRMESQVRAARQERARLHSTIGASP